MGQEPFSDHTANTYLMWYTINLTKKENSNINSWK
jgi:hypothetical protein